MCEISVSNFVRVDAGRGAVSNTEGTCGLTVIDKYCGCGGRFSNLMAPRSVVWHVSEPCLMTGSLNLCASSFNVTTQVQPIIKGV